jgi:two-component system, OmpR family, alkaline phosphatase synthesis response regulator PhoP
MTELIFCPVVITISFVVSIQITGLIAKVGGSMSKLVLIVDDEAAIQTVVQFGIRMVAGWDVMTASSGSTGIQIARAEQPDAILLDVMMPDMDGLATLKALQSHPATKQIPVIFLTATAQESERKQFEDMGAIGAIAKPFNALDLSDRIAKILHW